MIAGILLVPVIIPCLAFAWSRRRRLRRGGAVDGYPESMTAHLDADAEEYLAWLADHHWPEDEYLDLERDWRRELDLFEARDHDDCPVCPGCRRPGPDVWPCPECGLLVHSSCGHGMRRRKIARPYRTQDMSTETVIAEWICSRCTSVVGLDVDRGDEEKGRGLHQ